MTTKRTKADIYQHMLDYHINTCPILTSPKIHPDIPTVHHIGTTEAHSLRCTGQVRHLGFGFFEAETPNGTLAFDGGGAMRKESIDGKHILSWSPLRADQAVLNDLGYDRDAVQPALQELLTNAQTKGG